MGNVKKPNILICVTGSIAAYKSVDLIRLFKKNGHNVRVVMTESANEFITPLTLQAISGNKVSQNLLDADSELAMGHIELAKWADFIVVAPCSAESISRLSLGRADDLFGAIILATKAEIFIAPAMNMNMWSNEITKQNMDHLSSIGMQFVGPAKGDQACGDDGYGRMSEPEEIFESISMFIKKPLLGKKVIVTAGPTREQIDPVRFISNNSSGKMGFAMAEAAYRSGADVYLIAGPVSLSCSEKINRIDIQTAKEMHKESLKLMSDADIFVGCAAVADFRPEATNKHKVKKTSKDILNIRLIKNIDIISTLAEQFPEKTFMGFCAETEKVEEYAKEKLISKGLDFIVANDVSKLDIGFDSDFNEVSVFYRNAQKHFKKSSKSLLAIKLINILDQNSQSFH